MQISNGYIILFLIFSGSVLDVFNVTTHGINSAYVAIDICLSGIPARLLHMYQPIIYGAIYTVFTVIYWAAGGTNERNHPYIYSLIDYNTNATRAVLIMVGTVFIVAPVLHLVVFSLIKLKEFVYAECCEGSRGGKSEEHEMASGNMKHSV